MVTKTGLALELRRIARMQVGDVTRAVKDRQKVIALNEVTELTRSLNRQVEILGAGREPASATAASSLSLDRGLGPAGGSSITLADQRSSAARIVTPSWIVRRDSNLPN